MLAYEYLKSNPQQNGKRINSWRDLFTDPTVPHGVKAELLELNELTNDTSDAMLYFHGIVVMDRFLGNAKEPHGTNWVHEPRWLNALYTYLQLHPENETRVKELFWQVDREAGGLPTFSNAETLKIVTAQIETKYNINRALIEACFIGMRGGDASDLHCMRGNPADTISKLFQYMTMDFVASANVETLNRAYDMFRDVDKPDTDAKYASVNALERAHDAKTAAEVKKLLKENPETIVYDKRLLDLVKEHGFKLPVTKNDMIERGARHHNCVATYAQRHCANGGNGVCRLLFTTDATVELTIYTRHDMIVAVTVPQMKGRYNKDVEQPLELSQFRVALTGMPSEVINVKVVSHVDY